MKLAFNSKSEYVPNPHKDPSQTRWIASLSDGSTVFEDLVPGESSAWVRLGEYVKHHKLKITNLRLEAYGRNLVLLPYKDAEGNPQINGYWHSKGMSALLYNGVVEFKKCGIGFIKGKQVIISWVHEDGHVSQQVRDYEKDNRANIINDHPC